MPTYEYICEVCGRPGKAWRPEENGPPRFCGKPCMTVGMAGQARRPVKYVITPEMHAQIEKVYKRDSGNGQVAALAKALRLPRWKVTRYAISQGWVAKQRREPNWTEAETEQLQKLARYSIPGIRRKMAEKGYKRSETAIVLKLKRMNRRQNLTGHSARDVARCLGVDDHFVTRAIRAGRLRATRRGTARTDRQGVITGGYWIRIYNL